MDKKKATAILLTLVAVMITSIMILRIEREKGQNESNTISNEVEEQNTLDKQNAINETKEETNLVEEQNIVEENIVEENKTKVQTSEFQGEEETKENEQKEDNNSEKALDLVKEDWGEDDTVYYTIDNESGSIFNISVRSKETTGTLAEYEVDISNSKVTMK